MHLLYTCGYNRLNSISSLRVLHISTVRESYTGQHWFHFRMCPFVTESVERGLVAFPDFQVLTHHVFNLLS